MVDRSNPQALLSALRAKRGQRSQKAEAELPDFAGAVSTRAHDFADLPGFQEMRFQKAASEQFQIGSPFFKQAEAVDGARIKINGDWLINYASYDYLGLNQSDAVRGAVVESVKDWGVSASASRLVGGEMAHHEALETRLAEHCGTQAALVTVSGHATNIMLLRTILGPEDLVLVDKLAHNSVYEGIHASGATHLSFPHNDWDWVDRMLTEKAGEYRNALIAVEGLYSMDGDIPDLAKFVEVKARHGAWLMVDEAHSFGVLGKTGQGLCEHAGVSPECVEILMGTLSKSLCSCGGYVAGPQSLIEYLKFKAPGFVYSVGLSAPNSFAAKAALDAMIAEPGRVERLRENGAYFLTLANRLGMDCGESIGSAVAPIILGDSLRSVLLSDRLSKRGVNALPIIYPAVPEKRARLRFFLTAAHTKDQIDETLNVLSEELAVLQKQDPNKALFQ